MSSSQEEMTSIALSNKNWSRDATDLTLSKKKNNNLTSEFWTGQSERSHRHFMKLLLSQLSLWTVVMQFLMQAQNKRQRQTEETEAGAVMQDAKRVEE